MAIYLKVSHLLRMSKLKCGLPEGRDAGVITGVLGGEPELQTQN
jgi:hypothetical protein